MDLLRVNELALDELKALQGSELNSLQDSPVAEELAEGPELFSSKFQSTT